MNKTSQWAGYTASFFAIAFFVTATTFRRSDGEVPGWFAVVTGWCMMLAAFAGVVCLVSGVFAFVRRSRQRNVAGREVLHDNDASVDRKMHSTDLNEAHSNYRDEQFWFTAAVVGFNAVVLDKLSGCFWVFASGFISLFGIYILLTRWVTAAGRQPPNPPEVKSASATERARYTVRELLQSLQSIPYVVAEFSGTLFYLLVIGLTFVAVLVKFLK